MQDTEAQVNKEEVEKELFSVYFFVHYDKRTYILSRLTIVGVNTCLPSSSWPTDNTWFFCQNSGINSSKLFWSVNGYLIVDTQYTKSRIMTEKATLTRLTSSPVPIYKAGKGGLLHILPTTLFPIVYFIVSCFSIVMFQGISPNRNTKTFPVYHLCTPLTTVPTADERWCHHNLTILSSFHLCYSFCCCFV